MAVRKLKPTSAGRRFQTVSDFAEITRTTPEKSLTVGLTKKAGRNRWLGRRPQVRGVAMNPIDHPLGGGEGRSSGGRHPVSPWGMPAKGFKTRDKNKASSRLIIKRRGQK